MGQRILFGGGGSPHQGPLSLHALAGAIRDCHCGCEGTGESKGRGAALKQGSARQGFIHLNASYLGE